ncbi:hypothetical protein H1P_3530003 [Hyella patelloides LEGE 07179]|uniref:Uncharacterized protein n=1 Tax=Hyella patelloides LEGE 07179 TaxID=945734 RepID=A0A563VW61_9CYAN|nr:hypothetical protein H1P_3530003 [Hyella patelloides LEGE 07179]
MDLALPTMTDGSKIRRKRRTRFFTQPEDRLPLLAESSLY